jgi:hypothetical protein
VLDWMNKFVSVEENENDTISYQVEKREDENRH